MTNLIISTDSLTKRYGKVDVLDSLSLNVPSGSTYCLLGKNGSGKTTTIRLLLGLARPDSGHATVFGQDVMTSRKEILQRCGFVSDKPLIASMTGKDLIKFNRGFYPSWSDSSVNKYADALELSLAQRFKHMSRGNQTKLWLLLALAQQPDLLILDEPTAGLDPIITDELLRILVDDFASEGKTIFLSSHHIAEVERIADWVGILDQGKLIFESKVEDVRADFRRIQVFGNNTPQATSSSILRTRRAEGTTEYILRKGATDFTASLVNGGAQILRSEPMNLSEVFMEFARKE